MADLEARIERLSPQQRALLAWRLAQAASAPSAAPQKTSSDGAFSPLTPLQEGIWIAQKLAGGLPLYDSPGQLVVRGPLDACAIEASLRALVQRHGALRARFEEDGGRPGFRVDATAAWSLDVTDLRGLDDARRREILARSEAGAARSATDLARPPLWRISLFRLGELEHRLSITVHHLISDGASLGILVDELGMLYEHHAFGRPLDLPAPELEHREAAAILSETTRVSAYDRQLDYWTRVLAPPLPRLELPGAQGPASWGSDAVTKRISAAVLAAARRTAATRGSTVFMVLLASFECYLARLNGRGDALAGVPFAGRDSEAVERAVGLFARIVPVRARLADDLSFDEAVDIVRDACLGAFAHPDVPLSKISAMSGTRTGADGARFIQATFAFQTASSPPALRGTAVTIRKAHGSAFEFDLGVFIEEAGSELECVLVHRRSALAPEAARAFLDGWLELLAESVADGSRKICALPAPPPPSASAPTFAASRSRSPLRFDGRRAPAASPSDTAALVATRPIIPGQTLPWLVTPAHPDVDLAAWLVAARGTIDSLLARHGALLFRGFGVSNAARFEDVARAATSRLQRYVEGSSPRTLVTDYVYTSTEYPQSHSISLHNELSYAHVFPARILFYCDVEPTEGGETPLADCREVFARLHAATRESFARRGVRYERRLHSGVGAGLSWQTVFETTERAAVERYCRDGSIDMEWTVDGGLRTAQVRRAFARHPRTGETVWFNQVDQWHPSNLGAQGERALRMAIGKSELPIDGAWGDGAPLDRETLDAVRRVFSGVSVTFSWRRGDVLLLDNMLVAHGRRPFAGERRVLVAMGDPVAAAAVALDGTLEHQR
jgi:alpha-ketoglutarate-dependent taurine dioxygenase